MAELQPCLQLYSRLVKASSAAARGHLLNEPAGATAKDRGASELMKGLTASLLHMRILEKAKVLASKSHMLNSDLRPPA